MSTRRNFDEPDLTLAVDLAGRAAMAIENAALYERAQASSRAKSDFLAVMSHELRTPLTAIQGYTELMLSGASGPVSDKQTEQLERVTLRSRDLVRIIDEILDYARTENGEEEPRLETIDLAELLRGFADTARSMAEAEGLDFQARIPDEPLPFETDAKRLEHIVMNLVSNAIRFTERGSVKLEARLEAPRVRIRVVDTGIGIDPSDQERIFEPFVQVGDAITRDKEGTGLAIALRFARLLDGEITVESAPGEGSAFTLELPVRG